LGPFHIIYYKSAKYIKLIRKSQAVFLISQLAGFRGFENHISASSANMVRGAKIARSGNISEISFSLLLKFIDIFFKFGIFELGNTN